MSAAYNAAVDTLAENVRWLLSKRGIDILEARSAYLTRRRLTQTDTDDARRLLISVLSEAEPVFWPKAFCDIIEQSYGTLPLSWRLTDPMLFTPHGFMHFEKPISLIPSHPPDDTCMGRDESVTSIGWRKVPGTLFVDLTVWCQPGELSMLDVFPAAWMHGRISDRTYAVMVRAIRDVREQHDTHGPEGREHHWTGPLFTDERGRRVVMDALREVGAIRPGGIPWLISPWRSGQTIEQTTAAHMDAMTAPENACPYCQQGDLRLFGAALNFLASKVFVTVPSHTDRAVLRRAARSQALKPQWDHTNVVTLRKAERIKHESDEEETQREWSCHWLVGAGTGGFWRRQPVKNDLGQWVHEWRWIRPYIKGDLDKPFKSPSKRVYNVAR